MIRAVLAVALAVALVGASLPAIDAARAEHAAGRLDAQLDRVGHEIEDLATTEDPVAPGTPGARRVVTLRIPAESWTTARVDRVRLVETDDGARLEYALVGQPRVRFRVRGVRVTVPHGELGFRQPGRHRLVLTYVCHVEGATVVVRRG